MSSENGDRQPFNGSTKTILTLMVTVLLAFSGYAYYHSQETERIADHRVNTRIETLEARMADTRERLRSLESRIDRHEMMDDTSKYGRDNRRSLYGRDER